MTKAKKNSRVYLEDMASAINRIEQYSAPGKKKFFADSMLQDAIIRQLSIAGEAASKLPKSFQGQAPNIPWKQIIGLRNVVIHDYSEVNLDTIWETIEQDLPALRKALKKMMESQ